MNVVPAAKKLVSLVVSAGTGSIVGGIINKNVQSRNLTEKVTVPLAGMVLAGMLAQKTEAYTNAKIDELARKFIKQINENTSAGEIQNPESIIIEVKY